MNSSPVYHLVLDQGTSSTKVFLFDSNDHVVFMERCRHSLQHPKPKHVENNPLDILHACYSLIMNALTFAKQSHGRVSSIGLAVQRSTFLFWDKETKEPLTPAISWQDTRAWREAEEFNDHREKIWGITGTPLSPHFGGPKFLHCVRNDPHLLASVQKGDIWFGPLSSFLTHALTGVCSVDESIACRSLLLDIYSASWSPFLLDLFQVPETCLPSIVPTVHDYGFVQIDNDKIPLLCVIGDQQAALIGQGGAKPETFAMNLGTSGSVQFNTGENVQITSGLLSSILFSDQTARYFMLEGTITACNALFHHLEEKLNIPHQYMRWNERCLTAETDGVMIPGYAGLAAPYWIDSFTSIETGLEQATDDEQIRAAMESIGFLIHDIFQTMQNAIASLPPLITVSGGGARTALLQFIADLLNVLVGHTSMKDRTALGVNQLLKYKTSGEMPVTNIECEGMFSPKYSELQRNEKLDRWRSALQHILG